MHIGDRMHIMRCQLFLFAGDQDLWHVVPRWILRQRWHGGMPSVYWKLRHVHCLIQCVSDVRCWVPFVELGVRLAQPVRQRHMG